MTPQFYTPSGRYPQSALKVFSIVVFLSTALSGTFYGWFISEFGFSAINHTSLALTMAIVLIAAIVLNAAIVCMMVKKLKNHEPNILKVKGFYLVAFVPIILILLLCGFLMPEPGFPYYTNANYIFLGLVAATILNGAIISWLVKKLKIRSPTILGRLTARAAFSGWVLNWFSLYGTVYFNHKTEMDIVTFIFNRLSDGIQGIWPIRVRGFTYNILFHVPDFILLPLWLLEALTIPYLLARWAACEAGYPFSENKGTWHSHFHFHLKILSPEKKELLPKILRGDINALLTAWPPKYDRTGWNLHVSIFSPQGDGDFYIGVSGKTWLRVFSSLGRETRSINRYWQISPADIARLDERLALMFAPPRWPWRSKRWSRDFTMNG